MGQPVKVSDELLLDARLTSKVAKRSIAGQIEFWAQLGRAIEPLLLGSQALALCKAGAARPLSACLDEVDTAQGRQCLADCLEGRPYPHYEPCPGRPGHLIRIEADGARSTGRFVQRRWVSSD